MEHKTLSIQGMTCQMCVKHVTQALSSLDGVQEVAVSLETNSAEVSFDPATVGLDDFKSAVTEAGYEVTS